MDFLKLLQILLLLLTPVKVVASDDRVFDFEVETMWADHARGIAPLLIVEQSILRTDHLVRSNKIKYPTATLLFNERKRLLLETLPDWLQKNHVALVIYAFQDALAGSADLLVHLSYARDTIFNHLSSRKDLNPEVYATFVILEGELIRGRMAGIEVRTRNYGATPSEKREVLEHYLFRSLKSGRFDSNDAARGEEIIGISNEDALQAYAKVYEGRLDNSQDPYWVLLARVYDIFQTEPELRKNFAKSGSIFKRFQAVLSNDIIFKCQVLLGKTARMTQRPPRD